MATMSRRSFNLALAALSGTGLAGTGARAQGWPARPVTIVMPFAPGGGTDGLARAMAVELGERIGGRFIVENRTGAGGNIGGAAVAKADPDGYPLLAGWSRKGSLGQVTGLPVDERLASSVAAAVLAVDRGARIVRVHDVRETAAALKVWMAMQDQEPRTGETT